MAKFFKNIIFYLLIVLVAIMAIDYYSAGSAGKNDISYTAFMKHVQQDEVKTVTINSNNGITGQLKNGEVFTTVTPSDATLIPTLRARDVEIKAELPPQTPWWTGLLTTLLPMVLVLGIWFMLMNQGSGNNRMMNFGKSNARRYDENKNKVAFKDVAGADEAKQELQEVVEFLKHPQRYNALGAKIPKGVLLYGPPGTGKTLLARAVAGEAGVPFFSISGSDFVEMFVGVGASRVRDLFDQAKKNAPCIVFIDEIDAVGRQRGAGLGGHDEREQTLNQLLVEMDGFGVNEGIIMIAATNRPDILDHALLRPGRFDRQIVVDRPDMRGREAILQVHAKGKPMSPDVNMNVIAKQTTGFTGADLANLVNEAALLSARRNTPMIDMKSMNEAAERVVMGPERRSHLVSDAEKRLTAYHETGHTLVGLLHNDINIVHKVTIIPRGRAGGYTMSLPKDDRNYQTKSEMLDELQMLLGGRVAEAIVLKDISSGASSDLQRATQLARQMVCRYGMSDRLGSMTFGHEEEEVFLGRDIAREKYSNEVAAVIDEEVRRLMDEAYKGAEKLLQENMDKLVLIAETLLKKETLDGKQLRELMELGYLTEDVTEAVAAETAAQQEEKPAPASETGSQDIITNQAPPAVG